MSLRYNSQRCDMTKKSSKVQKRAQQLPPPKNAAAQALGRLGGQANTRAQQLARKRNAQKAGRPRRVCNHCSMPVAGGHVDRKLDKTCGQHGWSWERAGQPHTAPKDPEAIALDDIANVLRDSPPGRDAPDVVQHIARVLRGVGRKVR